jgi:hypothetical protein
MNWIVARIRWIMLVSGALTCTMLYAAVAPGAALRSTFGESLAGPLAEIIVRNWGVLIALVGAMLIGGAYNPAARSLILVIAGVSKLGFMVLVLVYGRAFPWLPGRSRPRDGFRHGAAVHGLCDCRAPQS